MRPKIIKAPKFSINVFEPSPNLKTDLPFMFSINTNEDECSTSSSSYLKSSQENQYSSHRYLSKSSFTRELDKIKPALKGIMDRNPIKNTRSRYISPEPSAVPESGLPYQRRARSSSPPRESLKIYERKNVLQFPARSPIIPSVNRRYEDEFSGLCDGNYAFKAEESEDEDLKAIKEHYWKLLESAPQPEIQAEENWEEFEFQNIESLLGSHRKLMGLL